MSDEIELISDGDGLAVIGEPGAVEAFLRSNDLPSRELNLHKLGTALRVGSAGAEVASQVAANAGRWVKMTEQSAKLAKQYGFMKGSAENVSRAVIQTPKGAGTKGSDIKGLVEIINGPGKLLGNPAVLAGAAGIMAQLAMQQAMDEITDYLQTIDEKVDDVLRAQKDAVFADMIGVDLVIRDALTVREQLGRVPDTTWSSVQGSSLVIARTQAYVLRQLDAIASKLEGKANVSELAKAAKQAERQVGEWLAVLARCVQLNDAVAILELDRVLGSTPDELDTHRRAIKDARRNRLELIERTTRDLTKRMDAAADRANSKVLFKPLASPAVVESRNRVAGSVSGFHHSLGLDDTHATTTATRWIEAVAEVRDDVLEAGGEGVGAAKRFGGEAVANIRSTADAVGKKVAERLDRGKGQGS